MRRNRRSTRLPGLDYTQPGAYFVTLCTQNRECLFGEVRDGQMQLNDFGHIVREEWLHASRIRSEISLDAFVVMPNHLHGILVIKSPPAFNPPEWEAPCRGNPRVAPTGGDPDISKPKPGPRTRSLGAIIALFKSVTGKSINEIRDTPGAKVWQRNFYDHIIRHHAALNRIRRYIEMNPPKWELDRENPEGLETF